MQTSERIGASHQPVSVAHDRYNKALKQPEVLPIPRQNLRAFDLDKLPDLRVRTHCPILDVSIRAAKWSLLKAKGT